MQNWMAIKTFGQGVLEDVFCLHLQKTSLSSLDQDQYICLGHTSSRGLQDILKTSSRPIANTSSRRPAKTSSRHLQNVLKRCLQDVFNMYHQVKLGHTHFWEIYGQCRKFASVIKVSQVLVFHFIPSFSGYLQRCF